ncbi:TadE/TadG family type IV pilus assembly protein [uncultured Tessaracoccus sp.]|uniref:TadE/TadG family type IV pilus assembly protein n=1 Tax=uncultured Tessaracoccus sp. TaxID=905023 RepID=UPI0025DE7C3A|nr:TadE/TadG family type IV pilus assembly protein [uncultured Tessaracoccus sp.]
MRHERGLAPAVEASILIPGLLLLVGLLVVLARITLAQQEVDAVASHAARAATLQRSVRGGVAVAERAIDEALAQHGVRCRELRRTIDAAALAATTWDTGHVRVRVSCRVSFADVVLPALPGSVWVDAEARSPVDRHRGR